MLCLPTFLFSYCCSVESTLLGSQGGRGGWNGGGAARPLRLWVEGTSSIHCTHVPRNFHLEPLHNVLQFQLLYSNFASCFVSFAPTGTKMMSKGRQKSWEGLLQSFGMPERPNTPACTKPPAARLQRMLPRYGWSRCGARQVAFTRRAGRPCISRR